MLVAGGGAPDPYLKCAGAECVTVSSWPDRRLAKRPDLATRRAAAAPRAVPWPLTDTSGHDVAASHARANTNAGLGLAAARAPARRQQRDRCASELRATQRGLLSCFGGLEAVCERCRPLAWMPAELGMDEVPHPRSPPGISTSTPVQQVVGTSAPSSASPWAAHLWLGYAEDLAVLALSLSDLLGCFGLELRRWLRMLDLRRRLGRRRASGCNLDVLVARLCGFSGVPGLADGRFVIVVGGGGRAAISSALICAAAKNAGPVSQTFFARRLIQCATDALAQW